MDERPAIDTAPSGPPWRRRHLCTALVERDGAILLVASRYPGHDEPLWNLPGGRHEPPETSAAAALRELHEETGLAGIVRGLAYVAESFDHATRTHWTSLCFRVDAAGEPAVPPDDLHACAAAWVVRDALAERLRVAVVREPLLAHLADPGRRYFGFADAGITVRFVDDDP